jgi:hypothetical protein
MRHPLAGVAKQFHFKIYGGSLMKNISSHIWFHYSFLLLCLVSCKKDNSTAVGPTTVSDDINTIRAKVNGVSWNVGKSAMNFTTAMATCDSVKGTLRIYGGDPIEYIDIYSHTINEGKYRLGYPSSASWEANAYYISGSRTYMTDDGATYTGYLTISIYDKLNKTVKGTFYFCARDIQSASTVTFTDGTFYLKLN